MKPSLFKLQIPDLVFISVLIIALASGRQMLDLDSDIGRHLTLGNYMLNERLIPAHDLFSHTRAGLSRPPYEWMSQILFALSNRLLGLDGDILLTSIVLALTFFLICKFASRRSGTPMLSLIITFIAAGAASIHWLPRPHTFTFLLLTIWIEYLEKLTRGEAVRLYTFPLLMLLWANLHGGFIFGILVWAAYFAGWLWETWRGRSNKSHGYDLLAIGVTSLITTVVTPDLWRNWSAVLNNQSAFILNRTIETMRPNLLDISILPYTFLLLLTLLLYIFNWKNFKAAHLFLLAGLGILSLLMARNIPLFAIASAPILSEMAAGHLSKIKAWAQIEKRFSGFSPPSGSSIWPITIVLLMTTYIANFNFTNKHPIYRFDPVIFPVEAANFLEANPPAGNMFNSFNWGGYLLYRLWPEQRVFIDGQTDFYGETLSREYVQVESLQPGWENVFTKYDVEWVIVPHTGLLANMLVAKGWDILYQDDTTDILRKP